MKFLVMELKGKSEPIMFLKFGFGTYFVDLPSSSMLGT
jgi:Na+-transporting methylmalonyl-CoA/oxaloacetate decarboxylase beta subunit